MLATSTREMCSHFTISSTVATRNNAKSYALYTHAHTHSPCQSHTSLTSSSCNKNKLRWFSRRLFACSHPHRCEHSPAFLSRYPHRYTTALKYFRCTYKHSSIDFYQVCWCVYSCQYCVCRTLITRCDLKNFIFTADSFPMNPILNEQHL